jgi:hypothetical protein
MNMRVVLSAFVAVVAIGIAAPSAYAAPLGHLSVGICADTSVGGGVIIKSTSIDWTPTRAGGTANGCIETGITTSVTYVGGGPLGPGVAGTIKDVTFIIPAVPGPTSAAVIDFMTFDGNPALHFDLALLGPGPLSTVCSSVLDANAPACSPSANSPYKLEATPTGTSLSIAASGVARDNAGSSPWIGVFTTQFAKLSPADIQTILNQGGSVSSTESGDFELNASRQEVVPEPTTLLLIGSGLIGSALGLRRRRKA